MGLNKIPGILSGNMISLITATFNKNLDSNVKNVQLLAEALDELATLASLLTTKGDLPYAINANIPARLPITTDTLKVLGANAGLPAWIFPPAIAYVPSDDVLLTKGSTEYTTTTREPNWTTIDTFRLSRGGLFRLKADMKILNTNSTSSLAVFYDTVQIAGIGTNSSTYISRSGDSQTSIPMGVTLTLKQRIDGNYDTTAYAKNIQICGIEGAVPVTAWT